MNLSFTKIKSAGLPKTSAKLAKAAAVNKKMPSFSMPKPKNLDSKMPKPIDVSKFTKTVKLPKSPKVAVLKKAIKKAKNVGY